MTLHTIIGNGGASYEFLNFNDTESLRVDPELNYADVGYQSCELRVYNVSEETYHKAN